MPRKPIELPAALARDFIRDMRAYFAEANALKRDEIAIRQFLALNEYLGRRERPLTAHSAKSNPAGDKARPRTREQTPPISTLGYATALSQGNRASASRGLGSIEMRRLQRQVLDAHGETLVTKLAIERSRTQSGPTVSYRHIVGWKRPGRPRSDDGSEYEPADFYAGLRYGPLMRKSWFSFAPS
jgi:hypothetical protein